MTYVPGKIVRVEREESHVLVSIENVTGHTVEVRITDPNTNALWAVGEYWEALKEHGEMLRDAIDDEMSEMGLLNEDEDDD